MGGFRFNGCGVTDHFKTIKKLGVHACPNCKKLAEFSLDEANQKIDVLWIPTLTIKSRYAVMCKKCKNGEFCSAEWAGYLINQDAFPEIVFESEAKKRGWSSVTRSFQENVFPSTETGSQPVQQTVSVPPQSVQQSVATSSNTPQFFKCTYCGVTQMREGNFCSYCGKPAPTQESPKRNASPAAETVECPCCGNRQNEGDKFCFKCGMKLAVKPCGERKCPHCGAKAKEGMLFCVECGTKL